MRVPFKELSDDAGPYVRPIVHVGVGGHDLGLGCLIDTGAGTTVSAAGSGRCWEWTSTPVSAGAWRSAAS